MTESFIYKLTKKKNHSTSDYIGSDQCCGFISQPGEIYSQTPMLTDEDMFAWRCEESESKCLTVVKSLLCKAPSRDAATLIFNS